MGCDWYYPRVIYGLALRTTKELTAAQARAIVRELRRARLADDACFVRYPILGTTLSTEETVAFLTVVVGKEVCRASDLTPPSSGEDWDAVAKRLAASMAPLGVTVADEPLLHAGCTYGTDYFDYDDDEEDYTEEDEEVKPPSATAGAASACGAAAGGATAGGVAAPANAAAAAMA